MFEFTETQKAIEKMARQYIEQNIKPYILELEEDESKDMFDLARKMFGMFGAGKMAKKGLEKLAKKKEENEAAQAGGKGGLADFMSGGDENAAMDPMMMMIMMKELCRVSPGFAMSFGVSMALAGGAVTGKGSANQIRKYGIPVMSLEKVGAWCLTEPGAGSDAFGMMQTTVTRDGDGYILNGNKTFITNAPVADFFIVYAKLDEGDGTPERDRQVLTFILDRGMEGFSIGEPFDKMGMRESRTSEIFFNNVKLGKENLLGEKENKEGRKNTKESLGNERSGVPAMCWGIIERCYDEVVALAKELTENGQPMAEQQHIQMQIYDMFMDLKNVEALVFRTIHQQKEGIRDITFINAAKAYASQTAVKVANNALQIFGEYGTKREYAFEKMFRDCKLLELGAGTTVINMLTAARNELGLIK